MNFATLTETETAGKTVLLRVDFNSPIDPASSIILDDKRFREHVPTVQALDDAKCVIITHQSRPQKKDFTTLEVHAARLERLIGRPVHYIDDIFGRCARETVAEMNAGDVLMLENVRFNAEENLRMSGEEALGTHLVRNLAAMGDIYVNDAFGTAHRSQPTIVGLPRAMPAVAGLLMEKEIATLSRVLSGAPGPVTFVLGGTKVDDSLDVAINVLSGGITDRVIAVGVVANVFFKAQGISIGSPSEDLISKLGYLPEVEKARDILARYGDMIVLPETVAVRSSASRAECPVTAIPDLPVLDCGLESIGPITDLIRESGTVVLNGPAGVFEDPLFAIGTNEILRAAACAKFSVVGGGHTAVVIESMGIAQKFSHISTGGGACIEFLTGKMLPAVEALQESKIRFW